MDICSKNLVIQWTYLDPMRIHILLCHTQAFLDGLLLVLCPDGAKLEVLSQLLRLTVYYLKGIHVLGKQKPQEFWERHHFLSRS